MTMMLIKQQSQTKTVRCFQSHFKFRSRGKLEAIPREVTAHLQPIRVLFNRAIQFCVYNSVNITKQCLIFQ